MDTKPEHIAALLARYFQGELTNAETAMLQDWVNQNEKRNNLLRDLADEGKVIDMLKEYSTYDLGRMKLVLQKEFVGFTGSEIDNGEKTNPRMVHRVHFLKTAWFRVAVAVLLILTGIEVYYSINMRQAKETIVQQQTPEAEILPGSNKAVLTLSDGKQIELNKATSETINDGKLSIENKNGQLIYKNSDILATNTMTTPKGGQYKLTLADGSKVWLNAASSITFPTVFNGPNREVSITGEVYFEIITNKSKPFVVRTLEDSIAVLGTSFNVNSYTDEVSIKTSLLEGKIKVNGSILNPGMAYIGGKIVSTNLSQDVAWKNGEFNFNDLNGEQAMRQLARWYNVEFKYQDNIDEVKFGGELDRSLTLNQILRGLEGIGGLHFIVQKNIVHVTR